MDIKILSDSCAKIYVSADECEALGIDYQSFSPDNISAQLFLASTLARLEDSGIILPHSDKITAEIFEQDDTSLVIYISANGLIKSPKKDNEYTESVVYCKNPHEVISAVKRFDMKNASLYKYKGKYAIITAGGAGLRKVSDIEIARIKEYWTLLSNTPYDKLSELE